MEELLLEIITQLKTASAHEVAAGAGKSTIGAHEVTASTGEAATDARKVATSAREVTVKHPVVPLETKKLLQIIRSKNEGLKPGERAFAKKQLLPYYLRIKQNEPTRWESWNINAELERALVQTLRMKPRRTASGVATITVLTKPFPCAGECLYCPNDLRMPKSYLANEPACQRAERNFFDPYLQVAGRLQALIEMGHLTNKVELIVLGGTFSEYTKDYKTWFVRELFRALNDSAEVRKVRVSEKHAAYEALGIACEDMSAHAFTESYQKLINEGKLSYNQAVRELYGKNEAWQHLRDTQVATLEEVYEQHSLNEGAQHRCVGLVVETRPDCLNVEELKLMRAYGCTKIQMGIQSLDEHILSLNSRATTLKHIKHAFLLLRFFGFKTHVHAMVNLYGSSAEIDKADYQELVRKSDFLPDEVKLYPCVLVEGAALNTQAESGKWRAYSEEELVDVLAADVLATPAFTRISRMIRDISSTDIKAGNKKTNLRQMVEGKLESEGASIAEIRHREIAAREAEIDELQLDIIPYETRGSREFFLQWVTDDNHIAGFLRLSLPEWTAEEITEEVLSEGAKKAVEEVQQENDRTALSNNHAAFPTCLGDAMIREVHVYGHVARVGGAEQNAQHLGLGRKLVHRAEEIARKQGYSAINVISAIGTRQYYEKLGYELTKDKLYLRKNLE